MSVLIRNNQLGIKIDKIYIAVQISTIAVVLKIISLIIFAESVSLIYEFMAEVSGFISVWKKWVMSFKERKKTIWCVKKKQEKYENNF